MTKQELRERFGSIPKAFAVGNKYRVSPVSHRISEQWDKDNIPEEWATFFWSVQQYEARQFDLVSLLPAVKELL
jgi:hypothetical protein